MELHPEAILLNANADPGQRGFRDHQSGEDERREDRKEQRIQRIAEMCAPRCPTEEPLRNAGDPRPVNDQMSDDCGAKRDSQPFVNDDTGEAWRVVMRKTTNIAPSSARFVSIRR